MGQFLVFDNDEERFKDWLKQTFKKMDAKQMDALYQSLKDHCNNFVQ